MRVPRRLLVGLSLMAFAPGIPAQENAGKPVVINGTSYKLNGIPMYTLGEPFSMTEKTTQLQPQPDGSMGTIDGEVHAYRDNAGRFRLEVGVTKDGQFVARRITIFDPVALTSVTFAPGGHKALLTQVAPRKQPTAEDKEKADAQEARSAEYRRTHPGSGSREALGTRMIAGEQADGMRTVAVYPAVGGQPEVGTTEVWTSPELRIALLDIGDFRGVHSERAVTAIMRGEPDAALFRVPDGYEIEVQRKGEQGVDMAGVKPPIVLYSPEPEFSKEARGKKISGNVMVRLRVMEDGSISDVRVLRGIGYGLDEEAVKAVKRYKFKPAMKDEKPVAYELTIEMNFQLF